MTGQHHNLAEVRGLLQHYFRSRRIAATGPLRRPLTQNVAKVAVGQEAFSRRLMIKRCSQTVGTRGILWPSFRVLLRSGM